MSAALELTRLMKAINSFRLVARQRPPQIWDGGDCFRRMVEQSNVFFTKPIFDAPVNTGDKIFCTPIIVDPSVPYGMGYLENEKRERVWFDMRTDEEKAVTGPI